MISLRARLFIIISLIVLFILGVSLFLLVRAKKITLPSFSSNTSDSNSNKVEQAANDQIGSVDSSNVVKVAPITSVDAQKKGVQQLAKIFFERANSYSSQSKFQNIRDVQSMVTESYWKKLSANLPALDSKVVVPTQDFSSQVAQVYSFKLSDWNEAGAVVDLQLKLNQEKNGVSSEKNAEAKVTLTKVGNNWLVSKSELLK